jgi:hypothetical protein
MADNASMYLSRELHQIGANMIQVEIKQDEKLVGVFSATEKIFKTGSRGFFGISKIAIGEKRYQVQIQMVEIGSRPKVAEKS